MDGAGVRAIISIILLSPPGSRAQTGHGIDAVERAGGTLRIVGKRWKCAVAWKHRVAPNRQALRSLRFAVLGRADVGRSGTEYHMYGALPDLLRFPR